MDWAEIQKKFPVNQEYTWLNASGTNPINQVSLDHLKIFLDDYALRGIFTQTVNYLQVKQNIKAVLARLLHCSIHEVTIIHNTAEGMNFISHQLDLHSGDELLLLENEYPSNFYPWLHWRGKGVNLETIPMGSSPSEFLENLEKKLRVKTRAISISAVHWCTGMPLPLADVGKLCAQRGIELIVDGAQGVGMLEVDVKKMQISYLAGAAWKWLLGPLGLGYMYISGEKLSRTRPIFMGSDSVVRAEEYLPYKAELKPDADRYIYSTGNFNDWVYFNASLNFLEEITFPKIFQRIYDLAGLLQAGLRELGFEVLNDNFINYSSGIVVCDLKGEAKGKSRTITQVAEKLREENIVSAIRLGRLRFSPHIHISEGQIQRVLKILGEYLDGKN
jgi:selenocysteine lyase/cysteine desulfurase